MAIRPYPTEYIKFTKISDNTPVILRPVRPEDELSMMSFLRQLSKETIVNRYLRVFNVDELTTKDKMIRMCCSDYDKEIAIIAEIKTNNKSEILGIARIVKIQGTDEAGFALIVKDQWQNKKVGKHLLEHVIHIAKKEKLKLIQAQILPTNEAMKTICKNAGFKTSPNEDKSLLYAKYKI